MTTLLNSLAQIFNVVSVLLLVLFVFSVIGMQLFGGTYDPTLFPNGEAPRSNFDDFFRSFVVVLRVKSSSTRSKLHRFKLESGLILHMMQC